MKVSSKMTIQDADEVIVTFLKRRFPKERIIRHGNLKLDERIEYGIEPSDETVLILNFHNGFYNITNLYGDEYAGMNTCNLSDDLDDLYPFDYYTVMDFFDNNKLTKDMSIAGNIVFIKRSNSTEFYLKYYKEGVHSSSNLVFIRVPVDYKTKEDWATVKRWIKDYFGFDDWGVKNYTTTLTNNFPEIAGEAC